MSKIKRGITGFLVICMLLTLLPASAFAQAEEELDEKSAASQRNTEAEELREGDFLFSVAEGWATITKYVGSDMDVTVPAVIGGYPVDAIDQRVFQENDTVISIRLEEGIRMLYPEWVSECPMLDTIYLPSTVYVYEHAYTGLSGIPIGCKNLKNIVVSEDNPYCTTYDGILYNKDMTVLLYYPTGRTDTLLEIPEGVNRIGGSACADAMHLKEVRMPDTVEMIGYWAFENCKNLEKINISESCTMIGQYAFYMTALRSIRIPAALTVILRPVFNHVDLEEIIVDPQNPVYSVREGSLYYNGDRLEKYIAPRGMLCYEIPENTREIAWWSVDPWFQFEEKGGVVVFKGDAPQIQEENFHNADTIAYYPADNATWTQEVLEEYSKTFKLTWRPLCRTHSFESYQVKPTCTSIGYIGKRCTVCQFPVAEQVLPATGHKKARPVVIPATCTEDGTTCYICSTCDSAFFADDVYALGHSGGHATCAERAICDYCQKPYGSLSTENHVGGTRIESTKEPTCTETGIATYLCGCGAQYFVSDVAALGHDYEARIIPPTYIETGYTEYTCSRCGDTYRGSEKKALGIPKPIVRVATDAMNGSKNLTWEAAVEGATYEIYRATSKSGKYTKVATVEQTGWTDSAASAGKTYYYKVKAIYAPDTSKNSGFSSVVSVDYKCAAPTLAVTAGSTGKPVLTWNKITGAKKYEIWRSVDGGAFKKLTTSTKLTYTDSKATAGAECTYKVKALGSKSAYNGEFSETDSCYVICAAPSVTLKLDSKTGKPALSWKKITGAKSYAIYRSANGGEYELLTTTTSVSYKDSSVQADNKYSYYVVTLGKAEVFNSVASAAKSITLAVKAPKLSGSANAEGKPVISWAAVENAVSYKIYRSTKSSKGYTLLETTTDPSYTDPTVATGKTFYYKVVAVGANTESAQSSYLKQVGKCATPTIQVAINEDSGKPVISWEKIEGAKKYTVYRATSETGKYKKLGTTTKLTYTDSKASVGTKYFYKIVANPSSSSANSNYSNIESCLCSCAKAVITAKVDTASGKPTISWKKVTGAKTYEIYRSENGGEYILVATQTAVSYKDTTAVAGNAYSYQVKVIASKTGADSLRSAEKTVTATCAQPKVKGKVGATGKPELTWGEVEGATKYVIYRSTSKSKNYKAIDETTELTFTDATATKGKTYYYKVVAVCESAESAQSAYVKVKSK